jgi:phosphoenolpyruvate carboxykinase (ATP)
VPREVPGVESHILDPLRTWRDKAEFARTASRLVQMFRDNFAKFEAEADEAVRSAGPNPRVALVYGRGGLEP